MCCCSCWIYYDFSRLWWTKNLPVNDKKGLLMESSFLQIPYVWQEVIEFLVQVIAPTITKYGTTCSQLWNQDFSCLTASIYSVSLLLKSVFLWITLPFTFLTTESSQGNSHLGQQLFVTCVSCYMEKRHRINIA